MNARFSRALIAKNALETKYKIRCFVPMQKKTVICKGKKELKKITPVFLNLIFVYTTQTHIKEITTIYPYLHFQYQQIEGRNQPLIIPQQQMEMFINTVEGNLDKIEYIEQDYYTGERVRITEGYFKDKEGILVKIKGKRSKQFVVAIEGLIAVSLLDVPVEQIERIN